MYQASRYTDISNCDSETDQPDTVAVYNGDRGIIKFATPQRLVVTFDQWGDVSFKRDCFHNIELGYALSCHKLQGSEPIMSLSRQKALCYLRRNEVCFLCKPSFQYFSETDHAQGIIASRLR